MINLPSLSSTKSKRLSLQGTLSVFVIVVTIVLIGIVAWHSWNAYTTKLNETKISTTNMAKALAQHAEDTLGGIDNVLVGLVEMSEQNTWSREHLNRMSRFMRQRVGDLPLLHGLFIYDEKGRWIANSQETLLTHFNNADREYFQFHRNHADRGPHIGVPIRSRSTNDWIITVSRRLQHADGTFAGVVLATINMQYFRSFYGSFDIGKSGTIFLASDTGTMLLRRPFDEKSIGSDITNGPVYQYYKRHGSSGTAILTAKIDKVERIYSYRHINRYPLLIAVALSKEEVFSEWRYATMHFVLISIIVIALIWLLGLRLARQIVIRERAQAELRTAQDELERSNGELAALALLDGLTGLANRRRFDAALDEEFARAMRNEIPLALIMLDVDHFKKYNDRYGHPQGDECLKKISLALKMASTRPGDLAARYGGEEFAILLPGTDTAGASAVTERIRSAIQEMGIEHSDNQSGTVTISAGIAAIVPSRKGSAPQDLVRMADQALYKAKENGRNRIYVQHFPALDS